MPGANQVSQPRLTIKPARLTRAPGAGTPRANQSTALNLKGKRALYPLSADDKKFQRDELRFQREVNYRRYLSWDQVLRQVDPELRYQTNTDHIKKVSQGSNLLDTLYKIVLRCSSTRIETITQVPDDFQQPPEDYCSTYTDPDTGKTMVDGHDRDPWSTQWFTNPPGPRSAQMDPDMVRDLTEQVISDRAKTRDCSDQAAVEESFPILMAALRTAYADNMSHPPR